MATTDATRKPGRARKAHSPEERRAHLVHAVHHTAHMLSEQGPMNITFVHNNTLLGLQKQHFHEAIETARQTLGLSGYEPDAHFLEAFARGRITEADLDESLAQQPGLDPAAELFRAGERVVTRGAAIKATLRADAAPRRPLAALRDACDPELGLLDLGPETAALVPGLAAAGRQAIAEGLAGIGARFTLGEWLGAAFGADLTATVAATLEAGPLSVATRRGEAALDSMGIPGDRRADYLARARALWGDAAGDALAIEARLVANLAETQLGCPGRLAAIADALQAVPEGFALRRLRAAAAAGLGVPDPLLSQAAAPVEAAAPDADLRPVDPADLAALGDLLAALPPAERSGSAARRLRAALAAGTLSAADRVALRDLAEAAEDRDLRARLRLAAGREPDGAFAEALEAAALAVSKAAAHPATLGETVARLTGIDVVQKVNAAMIRHLSAFTDEGLAALRMPDRHLGLFGAWRRAAAADPLLSLEGAEGWRDRLARLPDDAAEALIDQLDRLGLHEAAWEGLLGRMLVQLKGWAGMVFWFETHPNHPKQKVQPADTIQYLAMRLFTETEVSARILAEVLAIEPTFPALADWARRSAAEAMLRIALHAGELAPDLAEEVSLRLTSRPPTPADRDGLERLARRHWLSGRGHAARTQAAQDIGRVVRVAAQLGLAGEDLPAGWARALLAEIDGLTEGRRGRIWLEAYEIHYRDEVLNALAQNRGRGRWIQGRDRRPRSQVVFCIDEREENLHRYYGELDPEAETLGAAGFFGIAIAHAPLGGHDTTPLCPAVATPAHCVAEVPREMALDTVWPVAQRRSAWFAAFEAVMWEAKRNPVVGFLTTQVTGLFHAVPLLGRVFAPWGFHRWTEDMAAKVVPPVPTRLTHTRLPDDALDRLGLHRAALPFGFTVAEAADRVEAQLRNWGLTYQFARIVVICAHRSFSVNNPHENAHDCGACGGKAGGPNARLFAALANEPEVRAELRRRGIDIPEDTWFVGAEHNTCSDDILTFDTEDIPAGLRGDFERVRRDLDETSRRAARERCRRFRAAPKDASPGRSWAHVRGRSQDLSQVRPEWGHATNAFALVGRRALTQGLFFDRRGFVISYDPTQDGDGKILERILMAVGPVGAGINLEYYFSTVNPDGYGSGTKVPHNVAGLIGVMAGAQGDLATGLPRQMTEVHEAMRLQLIVDAPMRIAGEIYGRQPAIQELLNGQWVHLIVHEPSDCSFNRFVPGVGFVRWDKPLTPLPEVADSYEWIRGKHDCFLPPARIREPVARWDEARG